MTLVEICEPLFAYICKLNRLGRVGGSMGARQVRDEAKSLIADIKAKADKSGLSGQFDKMELPLIFFIDHMVRESRLAGTWGATGGWRNLAEERREMAGDERFFDLLEETLLESGENANQRLAFFYTMLGLGFTGFYVGQPEQLRRKVREVAARLRGMVETDQTGRICGDAYESVDTRTLTQPPARTLVSLIIVLIGMVVAMSVSYVVLFKQSTNDLNVVLDGIKERAK